MSFETHAENKGSPQSDNRKAQPSNRHHSKHAAVVNAAPYAPVPAEKFAEAFTPGAVRIALDRLVGHSNLGRDDLPDLAQELLKAAWKAADGYRPDYVSKKTGNKVRFATYIGDAMAKRATEILRNRARRGEDTPLPSLDNPGDGPDKMPNRFEEAVSFARFQENGASSEFSAMFDRLDLEFAIGTLAEPYRRAASMLLFERRPVDAVAVAFGVKATTIYHVYIPNIKNGLRKALLEHG